MPLIEFAQFGAVIFIAAVLAFAIKWFLGFAKRQEDNFIEVITNHLKHDTEAKNKLEQSNVAMTKVLEQLIRWLERNNKK